MLAVRDHTHYLGLHVLVPHLISYGRHKTREQGQMNEAANELDLLTLSVEECFAFCLLAALNQEAVLYR